MLEAANHGESSFVTLTYDDEHLPEDRSLSPRHVSLFLKKFRLSLAPARIRYFFVGEYGDETNRPHYHAALFGYPSCEQGVTTPRRDGSCCSVCDRLRQHWDMGHTYSGGLTEQSAAYIAGYVTKKMTGKNDERLQGRHPEFARMSNRPGIGAPLVPDIASTLLVHNLDQEPDVPSALRHGARILPLGRYLRRQLRLQVGKPANAPPETLAQYDAEMSRVREAAYAIAPKGLKAFTFKNALIDSGMSKIKRIEYKANRYRKRGSI